MADLEIKCYGICSDKCMAWKEGMCSIHAVNIREQEEKADEKEKGTLSLYQYVRIHTFCANINVWL